MKALAELNRRQISTAIAAESQPNEGQDYQPKAVGRPFRRGLHAVAAKEMSHQSDSTGVDRVKLAESSGDFSGVMSSVAANLVIRPAFDIKAKTKRMTNPMLTTEEFIQVRLATVRESSRHCYWPADVVARFSAADVIR